MIEVLLGYVWGAPGSAWGGEARLPQRGKDGERQRPDGFTQ
jgi:hypothetical protein